MIEMRFFVGIVAFVGLIRLLELHLAKQNAAYIRSLGGYEIAGDHYKWIVIVHVGFFAGLLTEAAAKAAGSSAVLPFHVVPAILFLAAQMLRVWVLRSLGRFWNTRIFVVPGANVVKKGPYRFLRHPNYVTVCIELLTLPLIFGLWRTALLFSLLNLLVLRSRIQAEEQALGRVSDYSLVMSETPRFFPDQWAIWRIIKLFNKR
ncbi:MAG: isoprenylcysteine carboxyl methyltransferase [Bacilli bacterium]|nr:isoprenylcysteine carboxyl methyltransferase [Bacilli bacterium]